MALSLACHGNRPDPMSHPATTTTDKVWLVEASGTTVADTSITFALAKGRTIVLRHAAPDDAIFLMLHFPAARDSLRAGDSVHVTIRPVRGKYAFTLATDDKLENGVEATFSYAMHFQTPAEAVAKYPNPGRFEAFIAPVELSEDDKVLFLPGTRPAADMIRFSVAAAGTYGLAAMR